MRYMAYAGLPSFQSMATTFTEIGSSGLKRSGGYVIEEFLTELSGARWKRVLRQMTANDPVINAFCAAVEMLTRQTTFTLQAASDDAEDEKVKDFVNGCLFDDMSASWAELLSEIITFDPWGFSYFETVFKRRSGENRDPSKNSRFDDNKIGWRKWAARAQDTVERWEFDDNGGIQAAIQLPPPDYRSRTIPIEKSLLFRTSAHKGNPEGVSTLRRAYTSYYFKNHIQRIEGIGIERDLAGLVDVRIPQKVIEAGGSILEEWKALAVNIRRDEQEGLVTPSDRDEHGNLHYEVVLLSTGGQRQIDTDKVINRYDQRILMSCLADFLILGHEKVGSFALSSDKTNLFSVALGTRLDSICDVINRHAVPRLLRLNGMPARSAPKLTHGDVESVDLQELGQFVKDLSQANFVFTDEQVRWIKSQLQGMPVQEEEEEGTEGKAGDKPKPVLRAAKELAGGESVRAPGVSVSLTDASVSGNGGKK